MAIRPDQPLIPSILDRLLDDEPTVSREATKSRTQVMREMKQSVRRDLESLLNTRRRCAVCPADFTELEKSLVSYGLPDIAGMDLSTPDSREEFRWQMEQTIRTVGQLSPEDLSPEAESTLLAAFRGWKST
jgi:type VI secretion system protein ImpF